MSGDHPLRIGVIGLGFIGKHHINAIENARRDGVACELTAVCDQNVPSKMSDDISPAVTRCETANALLNDPHVDIAMICTPTDTHVVLAATALARGKHVIVEKPVALRSDDVKTLAAQASASKTLCMPAMCMRFWPGWDWLRNGVMDRTFGRVKRAKFVRIGAMPRWSPFYSDVARSGGAMVDLHIHDVDFILWCFGQPVRVSSAGSVMHVQTQYHFAHTDAIVTAEAAWIDAPDVEFQMRFEVVFERAVVRFDINREPRMVVEEDGVSARTVDLGNLSGYDHQIREFIKSIRARTPLRATMDDAVRVTQVLEAEAKSLRSDNPVAPAIT